MTERENVLRLFRGELPEWLPLAARCMVMAGRQLADIERSHKEECVDWFGVHWLPQTAMGGVTHPDVNQPPVLKDATLWREQVRFPDLDRIDFVALGAEAQREIDANSDKLSFMMFEHGPWERLTLLMGFENALMALLLEPEAVLAYANAMADFKIDFLERLSKYVRYDLILYQDDLGSTQGPLMAPETWEALFKEPTRRIGAAIKRTGAIFGYHSCGRMEAFMDGLVDIGIEMINPVQTCNDQAAMKRKYPQLVFHGGLNNQEITHICNPTEASLRAEIRRAADTLGRGGGYIMQIREDNAATNGLNAVEILLDEFDKYTKDFYADPANRVWPR